MGPFKHTVDDGLDIRKAAFECMYTLLDSCLDRLDIFEFLNHVENGLKDHYDIKMLTYLMVARLAQLCPTAMLQSEFLFFFQIIKISFYYFLLLFFKTAFFRVGTPRRTFEKYVYNESKGEFREAGIRKTGRIEKIGNESSCCSFDHTRCRLVISIFL